MKIVDVKFFNLSCAFLLLVSFNVVGAIQDGGVVQTQFMPHVAHDVDESSIKEAFGQGAAHLRDSWLMMWNDVHPGVEPLAAKHQNASSEAGIPARRKQMYFRPVSVTLQCVMTLTVVCMMVYTFLSISRNYDELSATFAPSTYTEMLTIAARVSSFAPMLCMLFVACRMYILATTEGLGEPPKWVKICMQTVVVGVVLQLVLVLVIPLYSKKLGDEDEGAYDMTEGKMAAWEAAHEVEVDDTLPPTEAEVQADIEGGATVPVRDATGEQNDVHPNLNTIELRKDSLYVQGPFWLTQMLSVVCIYGGITGVIVGIYTFPSQSTKPSVAVLCTIYMSILYFMVTFILWFARLISESDSPLTNAALCMSSTVRKAPMFAVFFLASRMRALQLDPPYGMPPVWMQNCFYGITFFIYLEAFAAAYVGFNGEKAKGYYGVYLFRCPSKAVHLAHHGCAIITYAYLFPIIYGVLQMESASGLPAPLSTTLKCVINLEAVYFGVMLAQDLVMFAEEYEDMELTVLRDTTISAGVSLGLAPMLCILFVATRMRALQITQQKGDPPGWAQDCMLVAVFATCVQSGCCLMMPIFIGSACKVDEDGNPDYDLQPMVGAYAVAVVKYVALMALHGSVIAVCVSVYVMTPENAHDGGRFLTDKKQLVEALATTLVIFCIALLFSSAKVVGMAIKMVIEAADQALIGVDITIKSVALNLFKGYVNIRKLKIHNPEDEIIYAKDANGKPVGTPTGEKCDWKCEEIAKVELILVKINMRRLWSTMGQEIEIENISIKGVHFSIEKPNTDLQQTNSNVEYMTNHLDTLGLVPVEEQVKSVKEEIEVVAEEKVESLVEGKQKSDKQDVKKKDANKPDESNKQGDQKKDANKAAESLKQGDKKKDANKVDDDLAPQIIIHKIELGDFSVGVRIRGVRFIGEIAFRPSVGLFEVDDVQESVFNGKEDLKPPEMVACIISAIVTHVFHSVVEEIPSQLAKAASAAAAGVVQKAKSSVDLALKKIPCNA